MSNSRRKLPIWMMDLTADENEDTMIERKSSETKTGVTPKRRILRSNSNSEINPFDDTIPRRSTRSTSSIPEPKLKPMEYPFIEYKGSIKYLTDFYDIAAECDELLTWVENHEKDVVPIAFDMEWPFSFQTGSGKSAVIQICTDVNLCYVFHIYALKKLPAVLLALLSHDKIRLHGVNIKNDFRKLERDFPEAKVQKMVDHCVDLGVWCNQVQNTSGRWSMERLVSYICKLRIDKNRKVRMSQWHVAPLDENQKMYAAIDVYISQVIYYELEKRQIEKDIKAAKILEEYGQDSYNALKVLGRI